MRTADKRYYPGPPKKLSGRAWKKRKLEAINEHKGRCSKCNARGARRVVKRDPSAGDSLENLKLLCSECAAKHDVQSTDLSSDLNSDLNSD